MTRRRGTWAVLWMLGSCLPCGCYSAASEATRERSLAAAAGSPAADPCPARPLSEVDFCVLVASRPGGTFNPLPTCPRSPSDAGSLSCAASRKASPCGGVIVTVPDEIVAWLPGYVEYHYDADNMLIGFLRHIAKATGCAANQRFGKTCAGEAPEFSSCTPAAASSAVQH
jgi:hypothetical protein